MQSWQLLDKAEETGFGLICFWFLIGVLYIYILVLMQKNLLSGRHSVPHIAPDSKKNVCAASVCLDASQTAPPFHTYGTSLPPHITWSGEHCPTEVQLASNFNLFGSHIKK